MQVLGNKQGLYGNEIPCKDLVYPYGIKAPIVKEALIKANKSQANKRR